VATDRTDEALHFFLAFAIGCAAALIGPMEMKPGRAGTKRAIPARTRTFTTSKRLAMDLHHP